MRLRTTSITGASLPWTDLQHRILTARLGIHYLSIEASPSGLKRASSTHLLQPLMFTINSRKTVLTEGTTIK